MEHTVRATKDLMPKRSNKVNGQKELHLKEKSKTNTKDEKWKIVLKGTSIISWLCYVIKRTKDKTLTEQFYANINFINTPSTSSPHRYGRRCKLII